MSEQGVHHWKELAEQIKSDPRLRHRIIPIEPNDAPKIYNQNSVLGNPIFVCTIPEDDSERNSELLSEFDSINF